MAERRRPSTSNKDDAFKPIEPIVSIAIGIKVWLDVRAMYFSSLRAEACSTALPAVTDVELRYDIAKVSM